MLTPQKHALHVLFSFPTVLTALLIQYVRTVITITGLQLCQIVWNAIFYWQFLIANRVKLQPVVLDVTRKLLCFSRPANSAKITSTSAIYASQIRQIRSWYVHSVKRDIFSLPVQVLDSLSVNHAWIHWIIARIVCLPHVLGAWLRFCWLLMELALNVKQNTSMLEVRVQSFKGARNLLFWQMEPKSAFPV